MTRHLHLVCHAEADASTTADPGLAARGRRQAAALAARLARKPISAIHHSPRRRAAQTAEIVGEALPGVAIRRSDHLDDRTPVPGDTSLAEVPARYREWLSRVPADERDVDGTVIRAGIDHFTNVCEAPGAGDLVLVTHAFVVASYVRHALAAPAWRWMGLNAANASLTTLALTPDGLVLVAFNDTGHLVDLL